MKKFWKNLTWMTPELELVRGIILESIDHYQLPNDRIREAARSLFDPPGKMIRPGLLLLCAGIFYGRKPEKITASVRNMDAEQFRGEIQKNIPDFYNFESVNLEKIPYPGGLPFRFYLLAAAIEVLHTATLLHDDVLDNAELRRGRPTASKLLGNRLSILLGDHLLTMAFQLVSESASVNSARIISRVVGGICRGEMLQNSLAFDLDAGASQRLYKQRIAGKTAVMFSLAMYIGTREALQLRQQGEYDDDPRNDPPECRYIRRYGYANGMAFQIIDDILDLDIHADNGKTKGQDLRDGILTLPIIRLLKENSLDEKQIRAVWNGDVQVEGILRDPKMEHACRSSMAEAELYANRADRALHRAEQLSGLDLSELKNLTDSLLTRRS
ncbi:polyprenyl synthetase family protein [Salinispira pacifica]|uniref:Multifunctional octaprenyl-diphosphate synthase n=1 Tax=Salinispira pacifica TaxID=1307761 RepID=V5WLJ1_9SPIO|nr:polyprenyl synthetase family protein [Salinispira pacifica]AHC16807.1 multifunctional octaprenyl-diphosphate synthase [Salinispira pacifica]